jgi:DNA-directed RNA polymerase specialized sigma24 family protein
MNDPSRSVQMSTDCYIVGVNAGQIDALFSPDGFATKAAEFAARRSVRGRRHMQAEFHAIWNEIMLEILCEIRRYDPARGTLNTLVDRIARTAVISIYNKRERRLSRVRSFADFECLETTHVEKEDPSRSPVEVEDLRSDFDNFLRSLPPIPRAICQALQEEPTPAAAARRVKLSPWIFKKYAKKIRRQFQDAGLHLYLERH